MARRFLAVTAVAAACTGLAAAPAVACGGLVGENGTIQLVRTSTLAAYHDGVERYVTSFQFTGEGEEVGSIVPLPDVPSNVERGGDWTLQRLEREVAPPLRDGNASLAAAAPSAKSAEVLLETKIDALDLTVLRGGGDEVGRWATEHGFLLTPDAPEVLDFYARRSPVFLAARFDAARARTLGQGQGDGTPIMVTIPTERPWVPLRILGLGLPADRAVEADVFLLTDDEPRLLAGGTGLAVERSDAANQPLLDDLRSDKGMGWVPDRMWLTYLRLGEQAGRLDYDLAVSTRDGVRPSVRDAGIAPDRADAPALVPRTADGGRVWWPIVAGAAAGALVLVAVRGRRTGWAG